MDSRIQPRDAVLHPINFGYRWTQLLLDKLLSPPPPGPHTHLNRPKIAVIGAGITGVSAAAHLIAHGHDVMIFEAGSRESLGGVLAVGLVASQVITN